VNAKTRLAHRMKAPGGDVASGHGYHGVPGKGRAYDSYGSTYPIGQGEASKGYSRHGRPARRVIASGKHVIHPRGFKQGREGLRLMTDHLINTLHAAHHRDPRRHHLEGPR
jgi:hypothetical protein